MGKFISNVKAFMQDEEGLSVVEYVIGAGLIAGILGTVFTEMGTDMQAALDTVIDNTDG